MELWVGPVIVAAIVSGLVSAAGWFVTSWQTIRLEERRRREKVLASNTIYASLVPEIHILPRVVIGPVVDYARLREIAGKFAVDLRGDQFAELASIRQLAMYSDYLHMLGRLEVLAENALAAIDKSLGPSIQGAAPSTRSSAAEPGGASDGEQGEP